MNQDDHRANITDHRANITTLPKAVENNGSGGGLRIKLSFRVLNEEDRHLYRSPPLLDDNDFSHRCALCNKGFTSGKALGGHMRMHYQASRTSKDLRPSSMKIDNSGDHRHENDCFEKPICGSCGKDFPSLKALYGHMRSHPERSWRGIRPPSFDSPGECSRSLPRWSVTARRGRKNISAVEVPTTNSNVSLSGLDSDSDDRIHDAVIDLMSLAETYNSDDFRIKKRRLIDDLCDAFNDDLIKTETDAEAQGSSGKLDSNDRENSSNCRSSNDGSVQEQEEQLYGDEKSKSKKSRARKIEEIGKLKEPETVQDHHKTQLKYKCNICNKAFPTHQALGGHKSSHNKPKKIKGAKALQTSGFGYSATSEEDRYDIKFSTWSTDDSTKNQAHCSSRIVNMAMVTCKGGNSNGAVEAQSSQVTSPGESSQTGRRMLDFDLNEMPPMEEGEGIESCFS